MTHTPSLRDKLVADRVINMTGEMSIDGIGTIKFRALSRMELLEAGKIEDTIESERFVLSRAMLEPPMSPDDVAKWQAGSPGMEINDVADAINRLSGVKRRADKEAYKSLPGTP